MFHKWLLAVARSNQTLTVTRSKHDMYSHNLPTNTCELTTELQGKLKKFNANWKQIAGLQNKHISKGAGTQEVGKCLQTSQHTSCKL